MCRNEKLELAVGAVENIFCFTFSLEILEEHFKGEGLLVDSILGSLVI